MTEPSPDTWANSFGSTICQLVAGRDQAPEKMQEWLNMDNKVLNNAKPEMIDIIL